MIYLPRWLPLILFCITPLSYNLFASQSSLSDSSVHSTPSVTPDSSAHSTPSSTPPATPSKTSLKDGREQKIGDAELKMSKTTISTQEISTNRAVNPNIASETIFPLLSDHDLMVQKTVAHELGKKYSPTLSYGHKSFENYLIFAPNAYSDYYLLQPDVKKSVPLKAQLSDLLANRATGAITQLAQTNLNSKDTLLACSSDGTFVVFGKSKKEKSAQFTTLVALDLTAQKDYGLTTEEGEYLQHIQASSNGKTIAATVIHKEGMDTIIWRATDAISQDNPLLIAHAQFQALSPDGNYLLTSATKDHFEVRRSTDGKILRTLSSTTALGFLFAMIGNTPWLVEIDTFAGKIVLNSYNLSQLEAHALPFYASRVSVQKDKKITIIHNPKNNRIFVGYESNNVVLKLQSACSKKK